MPVQKFNSIKKTLAVFFIVFVISLSASEKSFLQTSNNVLIEYCTGIWCGYCPCADQIIDSILVDFPNTVVLAYHGENDDPWKNYSEGIRSLLGLYAYPSGIIGRRSGVVFRQLWDSLVTVQNTHQPTVSIDIVRFYNQSTRELNATANVTALINLTGDYYVNFVLTENNIVYPQAVSPGCGIAGTDSNYIHNHVVKGMLNGDRGILLNNSNPWNQNTTESKSITYTIPVGIVAENCNIVVFVYKSAGIFSSECHIQNAAQVDIIPTGISVNEASVKAFDLSQNYPNPFNPSTFIEFEVSRKGFVTIKVYDILGKEVTTLVNDFKTAGRYKVEFNTEYLPNLSSGIYFYRMFAAPDSRQAGDFSDMKKMLLIK